MSSKKRVLFLVPYPLHLAPSQRFRVEIFFRFFPKHSIEFSVHPFLSESTYHMLYTKGPIFKKALGIINGFVKRLAVLFKLKQYDYVFIHREAAPLGPPFFEWVIAKLFRKKIIFDFDDAIWIPDVSNKMLAWLKASWKIKWICSWAYKVGGGNEYLCNYARQYNKNVLLIPTCVDVERMHNRIKNQETNEVVIGWTGSHSTLRYLQLVVPVLQKIATRFKIRFLVICNQKPEFLLPDFTFLQWKEETEIEDLLKINIGIMPLQHDPWSEGKCGFKIIQYLALGIPAVASPVGVNKSLIEPGENGFLCTSNEEWENALSHLIENQSERIKLGTNGRRKVLEHFSIQANEEVFFSLFN